MKSSRRFLSFMAVAAAAGLHVAAEDPVQAIDFDAVREMARSRAAQPFVDDAAALPEWLAHIGYDGYRNIAFDFGQALWRDESLPFQIAFFHPGYIYPRHIQFHELDGDAVREHRFSPALFSYDRVPHVHERLPPDLGFPGFRVFQTVDGTDPAPLISFLGASYFRARTRDTVYGLSARGIAIDVGTDQPEEFPDFVGFWVRKPAPGDTELVVLALLDGPGVAGAYSFRVQVGASTAIQVRACITLRREVQVLGLCPFSSMFWFGENTMHPPPDFRPEVHDSDGLAIVTAEGESIWRPLENPARTRTDRLPEAEIRCFGLLQRDRAFASYQDLDADYHRRPDAWVVPGPELARGRLRLLEIETPHEFADNIALALEPSAVPAPGEEFCFSYTLHFGTAANPDLGRVVATRLGRSIHDLEQSEFVIDFEGGELARLGDRDAVRAEITSEGCSIGWRLVRRNPYNDTWRLVFRASAPAPDGARLKARLIHRGRPLTETWRYWWQPPDRAPAGELQGETPAPKPGGDFGE